MLNSDTRCEQLIKLGLGTFFFTLAAILLGFSLCYLEHPFIMMFSTDGQVLYTVIPDDKYEVVHKDEIYSAADYEAFTLYRTKYGKKWHLTKECQYIRESTTISVIDYSAAIEAGLSACSVCGYPDKYPD